MRAFHSLIAAMALVVAGCAGGGGANLLSRQQVATLLKKAGHGIGGLPQGGRGRSASTSGIAKHAPGTRLPGPDQYFDEEYQLWAEDFLDGDPSGEHTWGTHYFLDEAETIPAGDNVWLSVWNAWPMVDDQNLTIAGGPMAGLVLQVHMVLNNDGSGLETGSGFTPGEGDLLYDMTWDVSGLATLTARYTALDKTWLEYKTVPNPNGGTDYTVTSSQGVTFAFAFAADYSGTGAITGPSAALPATMEWDVSGNGLIHWASGPPTPFNIWEF